MKLTIINLIIIFYVFMSNELIAQTVTTLTEPFSASGGLSVDASGDLYVANFGDALNNANGTNVYKVTLDGGVTVFASGLFGASGNEFDSQGNLYQSNIATSKISKITPEGIVSIYTITNITNPVGVTVDENDIVYTTNCTSPGVIMKTTSPGVSTIFATNNLLSCPNGLTIDGDGNLYTSNFNNGRVIKITQAGVVSVLATLPGTNNGHLIFGNDRLYVVARGENRIYEVSLTGDVKLLAGTGSPGNSDGDALQSTWFVPNGIGISSDGTELYINDKVYGTGTQLNPVIVRIISGIDTTPIVGVITETSVLPIAYELSNSYPNPFNPITTIEYSLPISGTVTLIVYSLLGEEVTRLVDGRQPAGKYETTWNASNVASGIYFYRLQAGDFLQTRKMVMLK